MRQLRTLRCGVIGLAMAASLAIPSAQSGDDDPTPRNIDEFRAAAARVLEQAGVPGAAISLVRADGVEWEGGLGLADRDRGTRVTPDTHFRVGSVSKTFVAIAIMQMYYDDRLTLDDTVGDLAPGVAIDNPWHETHPVRVIHLLQHSAGFDDMHFNEMYNLHDPPAMPLAEVIKRNPNARRVRWQPGTRMSYSNPGYLVAGHLIETLAEEPYEDYIDREILWPLGMTTSSFRLRPEDEARLAQGYAGSAGPPTGFPPIYLRPAGNLHSSAREMGRFVRMLLNWGELDDEFIIDPEYLGNLERTSTTRAADAGLRTGYASGLSWDLTLPYAVIGHHGEIEGFVSTFGYSPARDVGYVILLNSSAPAARGALRRLSSLSIRFLKRDVEPPVKPAMHVDAASLDRYVGYYHDANPRNQFLWPMQRLLAGQTIARDGDHLFLQPLAAERVRLIPVTETTFRRDGDLDATMVFTTDSAGTMVLAGAQLYAERRPRWSVDLLRGSILAACALLLSPLVVAIGWVASLRQSRFWDLKLVLIACPIVLAAPLLALALTPRRDWGLQNATTTLVFLATIAFPALAIVVVAFATAARKQGAGRLLVGYAFGVALAVAGLTVYMSAHELIALRLWSY